MTASRLKVVLLSLAACVVLGLVGWRTVQRWNADGPAGDGREAAPPAGAAGVAWRVTKLFDFLLYVPRGWDDDYRAFGPYQVHFSAPEDDGFRPQLQVLWGPKDVEPKAYLERRMASSRDAPGRTVTGEGHAVVAGMPARWITYRQTSTEKGREREFLTVDFHFAGHGHVGMLRGVATLRTFLDRYRPLFFAIAAKLTYAGR